MQLTDGFDNFAEAYIYTSQYAQCIEQAKKVLEIDPTYADAHRSRLAYHYPLVLTNLNVSPIGFVQFLVLR